MNPMTIKLAAAGAALTLAAAGGFGAAWTLQELTITKLESRHKDERIASQRAARVVAERQVTQVMAAQNNATKRAADLAVVVAGSRTELDRLHDATAAALRAHSDTLEACTAHAATQSGLLDHCAGQLVDVSAAADGHVSDIKTLNESWPQ